MSTSAIRPAPVATRSIRLKLCRAVGMLATTVTISAGCDPSPGSDAGDAAMGVIDERFDRVVPRVDAGGNATDATDVIDARVDSGLVPFDARPPLPPNCNISREVDRDNDGLITCAELNQWLNQGWPQFDPRGYCLPCTEFDLFCDGQFPHSACMERPPRPQSIVWSAMCDRQTGLYNFDNFWVVTCQEGGLGD